jgi:Copper transport outer membrane protein, MctB
LISFRYHLVSIVAVFLALSLGVLMGTAVLNQGVIDELNRRTNAAADRASNLRAELDRLEIELADLRALGEDLEGWTLDGQLNGRDVVVVTGDAVDPAQVDGVRTALDRSGASVIAVVVVNPRMALPDEASRTELAGILEQSPDSPEDLAVAAAQAVGARLGERNDGFGSDLFDELIASEFVTIRDQTDGGLADIGGTDQAVVVLLGGSAPPVVGTASFFVPLVEEVVSAEQPLAAGETATSGYPFVPLLRGDGALDGRLVTVDNSDTTPGRLALILGLRRLFETGQGGDYGVKDGANGLIPPPP